MDNHGLKDLTTNKKKLFQSLLKPKGNLIEPHSRITKRLRDKQIPASSSQKRLWFLDQLHPNQPFYNIPLAFRFKGLLSINSLQKSLNEMTRRHEILRTVFHSIDGNVYQEILEDVQHEIKLITINDLQKEQIQQKAMDFILEDAKKPFDLSKGPLIRAILIPLGPSDFYFSINVHHIIWDGWSTGVFLEEFNILYNTFNKGEESPLKELALQYADFSIWQNEWMKSEEYEQQLSFWKEKLTGELPALQLPTDFNRPVRQTFEGKSITFEIIPSQVSSLKKLSHQHSSSLFMTLLAAFKTLIYRYTNQKDLVVGLPIANRQAHEVERLFGFFVNTLPLRMELLKDMTFLELLTRVRAETLEMYSNQEVPLEKIVEAIQPDRGINTPMIQVLFNLVSETSNLSLDGLEVEMLDIDNNSSRFDLEIQLQEKDGFIIGFLEYNKDLYEEETMERFLNYYKILLDSIIEDPSKEISNLKLMSNSEIEIATMKYNTKTNSIERNEEKLLHQMFEEHVLKVPNEIAVQANGKSISYQQLNEVANGVAHKLLALGAGKDIPVGICMNRSVEMIAILLGVLKSGSGYLPLDPVTPKEKLNRIFKDSNIPILITNSVHLQLLKQSSAELLVIDHLHEIEPITKNPKAQITPESLLYLIYTSGSTGIPKGIKMSHKPIVNLIEWQNKTFDNTIANVLQYSTLNFDMSCQEIFSALSNGGKLTIIDETIRKSPYSIFSLILDQGVTRLHLPYSAFQLLAEVSTQFDLRKCKLREITVSGEQFKITPQIEQLMGELNGCRLQNQYGPSETHVVTTYEINNIKEEKKLTPPIGKPIDRTQAYILNDYLQPVPLGTIGELYIGGICLANGYINKESLTKEKFIKHPFSSDLNEKVYKTGDLVRQLSNGNIEFIGRTDKQVKIRGYRVEIGEIEATINRFPNISEAIVFTIKENTQLIAYIVANQKIDKIKLKKYVKEHLPEYMVPFAFVQIENIPLNLNGKVNYKLLPEPMINKPISKELEEKTKTECIISEIWMDVLGIDYVGKDDHFFDLGGHSLLVTKVFSRIRNYFSIEIPLQSFFEYPILNELARYIDEIDSEKMDLNDKKITPVSRETVLPLSYSQERIWFFEQMNPEITAYNLSFAVHITGELSVDALQKSYADIITRHEAVRSTFPSEEGKPIQVIQPAIGYSMEVYDFTSIENTYKTQKALHLANNELDKPFDLNFGPLIRGSIFKLNSDEWIVTFSIHHIVSDGWSMSIFSEELFKGYNIYANNFETTITESQIQFVDYAVWQRNCLEDGKWDNQLKYWKEKLHSAPSLLQLPLDYPRPLVQSNRGATIEFTLDKELTNVIHSFCQNEEVSLYMTLLTVYKVVLYRYTGEEDLLVGTPVANRNREEWESLIGFFVNTLVIRSNPTHNISWREYLKHVKQLALEAYNNQDIPFEKIIQGLQLNRDTGYTPLFQVMFALQNTPGEHLHVPSLNVKKLDLDNQTSLFDLTLLFEETDEGLVGKLEYCTDLFHKETITRFIGHYMTLLMEMLKEPDQHIGKTPMLTKQEQQPSFINNTKKTIKEKLIYEYVEEVAYREPEKVAVTDGDQSLSYRVLNERADQLAALLVTVNKVKIGDIIGIYLDRSIDYIVSILAVLKTGASYVPLDPKYPKKRISWMIEDTRTPLVLTKNAFSRQLPLGQYQTVFVDNEVNKFDISSKRSDFPKPTNEDLAYVIYTSGSTGKPKGVMISHKSLTQYAHLIQEDKRLTISDRVAQFAPISFDLSIEEIFPTLISGATLVLRKEDLIIAEDFFKWIEEKEISILHLPTSYWHYLVSQMDEVQTLNFNHLRLIDVGGEKASLPLLKKWMNISPKHIKWMNSYGPTEATVSVCRYVVDSESFDDEMLTVPIGTAYQDIELLVLDKNMQPVPIGVPGELFIGGISLAKGYINLPEETSNKFIPHPFKNEGRIYQTGDRVRYNKDGQLEFFERIDSQVKIRGYRIELDEVEKVLSNHPNVKQALVVVRQNIIEGENHLVAYIKENKIDNDNTDKYQR